MRRIRKVAVLGAGVMGSSIACHLANAGLEVLLLDLPTSDGPDRNAAVNQMLAKTVQSRPSPLYLTRYTRRIRTGNFEDDMAGIRDCDWVLEAVVERLDVKNNLFDLVEKHRSSGTLVTTNTSGIPISKLAEGRSDDFRRHFCGTHFFNPPRYLRLLEIIPHTDTDQEVTRFWMEWGEMILGKKTVLAGDTPAFIANRIGVFAMASIYQLAEESGLSIDMVDKLTGPAIGRPKTGTFRLGDLVGHDTAAMVIKGISNHCPDDEQVAQFRIPRYLQFLLDNNFLGNKSGQGFYKKSATKDDKGRTIYEVLDLHSLTYSIPEKTTLPSLETARQIDHLPKRIQHFFSQEDAGALLIRKSLLQLFSYAANRIPEITGHPYAIDDALKSGFGWEAGPFETWDMLGVKAGAELVRKEGAPLPQWIDNMIQAGKDAFYEVRDGALWGYDPSIGGYARIPGQEHHLHLGNLRHRTPVFKNDEIVLHDIGDGVLCLEFTSKMNAIGEGILSGLNASVRIAEEGQWKGLVIGNHATNFTVGANLMMIAMMAYQQEWDELNHAVHLFQQTTMLCRYSAIPVVAATQGYVFGGGCELIMHCDGTVAAAESYIGLVEAGVGLIPGGGGTKEFAVRISDARREGDVEVNVLMDRFKSIALASVSTSAWEAYGLGYLLPEKDIVSINADHHLRRAKDRVLSLAPYYVAPMLRQDIRVTGRAGLATLYTAANELFKGNWASEHDIKVAKKTAWVLCGGDLTGPQEVSETYLLDLEREAFLSLCGEQKTLERIQHMLQTGKPLRN